jgi:hypothetical protein
LDADSAGVGVQKLVVLYTLPMFSSSLDDQPEGKFPALSFSKSRQNRVSAKREGAPRRIGTDKKIIKRENFLVMIGSRLDLGADPQKKSLIPIFHPQSIQVNLSAWIS